MQMEVARRGEEEEGVEKKEMMLILSCQAVIKEKKGQEETMWLQGRVCLCIQTAVPSRDNIEYYLVWDGSSSSSCLAKAEERCWDTFFFLPLNRLKFGSW